jgi:hypothetical protein
MSCEVAITYDELLRAHVTGRLPKYHQADAADRTDNAEVRCYPEEMRYIRTLIFREARNFGHLHAAPVPL